jgi:3,4-dehydroadipyl-CoA semialdehyde dehydrogenase
VAACVAPVLLGHRQPTQAKVLHEVEVFGPVATLMAYDDEEQAYALIRRGEGSLVASVYSEDPAFMARAAACPGRQPWPRAHLSPDVAASQSGHGNVMPMSLHGGPGRAGGGEELGGLRALGFYHRRSAVQASTRRSMCWRHRPVRCGVRAVMQLHSPFARMGLWHLLHGPRPHA